MKLILKHPYPPSSDTVDISAEYIPSPPSDRRSVKVDTQSSHDSPHNVHIPITVKVDGSDRRLDRV